MKTLTPVIICAAVISIAPHLLAAAKDNAPVPATNRLEKIRIAPDGKSFVTASGKPYAPVGLTYFRANTGWAPQVWKQFDAAATRRDFAAMKELGVNCVRVFISFTSFCDPPGQLNADGIAKFDEFLKIAEEAGIYVHPTGPDLWEGIPEWARVDQISDEKFLQSLETFWSQFAKRYAGRNVIFAYDLRNEPAVPWKATPAVQKRWSDWLLNGVSNKGTGSRPTIGIDAEAADCERACPLFRPARYPSREALAKAWGVDLAKVQAAELPPPEDENKCGKAELLDYQLFREDLADEWTRRQVKAIKAADPAALCTVGFIQWSVPTLLPGLRHYAAFRPERQAPLLDFLEIHFYPFGSSTDWETSKGDDRYRRAIYTTWRRSNPYPSMATFDAPNRETCTLRRTATNTPLQSLVTLNDPAFIEAAQALARLALQHGGSADERIAYMLKRCLLRVARPDETKSLVRLYNESHTQFAGQPAAAKEMATVPLRRLPAGMEVADAASMTVVANVLLNLDETFLKR
jgi:hypothetical protein